MAMAVAEEGDMKRVEKTMSIFSEKPKSFKISRKSPLAARLCSSISDMLLRFLGDYTDDVLAEYITVLVCNGKDQYHARDDLEAFLGNRSGEFVSWLWAFLLKWCTLPNANEQIFNSLSTVVSSHVREAEKDVMANNLRDLLDIAHGDANMESTHAAVSNQFPVDSNSVPSHDKKVSEGIKSGLGIHALINKFHDETVRSETYRNDFPRGCTSTEYSQKSILPLESSRKKCSAAICEYPACGEQSILHMDTYKKIVGSNCNEQAHHLLHYSRRELVSRNLQPHVKDDSHPQHIVNTNDGGKIMPPVSTYQIFHKTDNLRRSVWDRLGKPCEDTLANESTDGHGVRTFDQPSDEGSLSVKLQTNGMTGDVSGPGKHSDYQHQSGEYRKSACGASVAAKLQVSNIGRKRHFGEISTGCGTDLACSKGQMDPELECKARDLMTTMFVEKAREIGKPTQVTASSASDLKLDSIKNQKSMVPNPKPVQSEMLKMKQKLQQIEIEMFKLRSKQVELKKDGKPNSLSCTGSLKPSEEDSEMRTVLVTNVHFAATKDSLLKYFAKCGVVLNVVTLTDGGTCQMKGAAYVTFASKDAVEKALALSGTSFFSRTVKIVRKSEAAAAISASAQFAEKLRQGQISHVNRISALDKPCHSGSCLQWRREPSVSTKSGQGGASASASQQQPPGPRTTPTIEAVPSAAKILNGTC